MRPELDNMLIKTSCRNLCHSFGRDCHLSLHLPCAVQCLQPEKWRGQKDRGDVGQGNGGDEIWRG